MRQPDAERRRQHAGRRHDDGRDQRDVAEREGRLQRQHVGIGGGGRPARIDVAERAGNRDQHAEPGRGRDRLVDRAAVEGHEHVGELAAADPHQRRQHADHHAIGAQEQPARHLVGKAPAIAAEQQPRRRQPGDHHEHDLEQFRRRIARDQAAEHDAGHHRHRPVAQHAGVDRAFGAMGIIGADRGRDDDGERGADAQRHAHAVRHVDDAEQLIERRHQHGAAADAEQAGQKTRDRAGDQQCQGERRHVEHRQSGGHVGNSVSRRNAGALVRSGL